MQFEHIASNEIGNTLFLKKSKDIKDCANMGTFFLSIDWEIINEIFKPRSTLQAYKSPASCAKITMIELPHHWYFIKVDSPFKLVQWESRWTLPILPKMSW